MVYYNAYVQITFKDILVVVTNEKSKNQVTVVDAFQMSIKDYVNDNGLIQYPLILAEDVTKRLNNDRYSVKDITLIISPRDTIIQAAQENVILNQKELGEYAKSKIDSTFKKPPEAYEMAWLHTGNILDDGAPYSIFVQYCYPLREVNKLKKAFQKNKIHVTNVLLPELATAALFAQYYDEFNDPTTLIVESGYVNSANSATTTYWFKRNIFESIGSFKIGLSSIVKEIGNTYTQLSNDEIITLMLGCGVFKEYPTDDADEIFSLSGIKRDEWYAVATRAFHTFALTLRNDIQRRAEKPDIIILTGMLACIPGVKEYLYHTYSIVVDMWENKFDTKIGQTSVIYSNSAVLSPIYATVIGAVYYQYWARGMKKGTLSKPVLEINISKYNNVVGIVFFLLLAYAGCLFIPKYKELRDAQSKYDVLVAETETAQEIQANIDRYTENIASQQQFIEKSQRDSFDIKEFMFNVALLKPDSVTIISIDTPNYLEDVADTEPYYYIRKAVENKLQSQSDNASDDKKVKDIIDISGKDWTFGLDWTDVPLTTEGIKNYLEQNNQLNVSPYLVTKVVIRGYGPQDKIASYVRDISSIEGVYRADIVSSEEKSVPDGSGSVITSNVFEINVWFKGGTGNEANSEDTN